MANEFDYEAIFGVDFSVIREGLEAMPDNVEGMLLGVMDSMVYNVENFATTLEQTVTQLTANGMSQDVISNTLKQDYKDSGRIFGKLKNDTKANLAMGASNSGRMGQYSDYTSKDLFAWVTVAGHRICKDCDGMGGQINTYADWEAEGLPGSGWSVCQGYCYCVLDPSGKISSNVQMQRPGDTGIEKHYYKQYGLSPREISNYEKIMRLNSKSAKEMMAGKGISSQQVYKDFLKVRTKLSKLGLTKDKYYNKVTGKYISSRAKLHQKIARDLVNKGKIASGDAEFLMSGGYPGSGKSTMLDQAFPGWRKKFVHIDSDEIKKLLAKFDGIDELGWRAYAYHDEADAVIDLMFKMSRAENRNILFDGTMKNYKKMKDLIMEFKEIGYKTSTAFADLPIEKSIERAIARFYGESGRFVDPIYIITHGNQNINTFEALKELVDSWAIYNTDVPKNTPALFVGGFP